MKTNKIIGVFCGSFNPMHVGHFNILQKTLEIFDEVIIAVGINPDKYSEIDSQRIELIRFRLNGLKNVRVEQFTGFLTDFIETIEEKDNKVVLIRGLRNGADLDYEVNQYRFLKDLKPDIKVIFLPCDKEFEHISSSAIRNLEKIKPGSGDKYIAKL